MEFIKKIKKKWEENKYVCVGLDPVAEKLPKGIENFFEFNKKIVDATHNLVAAYKPNSAFYEGLGAHGIEQLKKTIDYIQEKYPDIFVLLDAKRADIESTNNGYISYAFEYLNSDGITLHPYLGKEALVPFLKTGKGIFVLCRTSNPGAGEFQDLALDGEPFYIKVAQNVSSKWNDKGNCGLVVGATYPEELMEVRKVDSKIPILIPGIGAQGGDLEKTVKAARQNFLVSSSRSIIFASGGPDFAEAARRETQKLHGQISAALST